jgi:hypothetical protein
MKKFLCSLDRTLETYFSLEGKEKRSTSVSQMSAMKQNFPGSLREKGKLQKSVAERQKIYHEMKSNELKAGSMGR